PGGGNSKVTEGDGIEIINITGNGDNTIIATAAAGNPGTITIAGTGNNTIVGGEDAASVINLGTVVLSKADAHATASGYLSALSLTLSADTKVDIAAGSFLKIGNLLSNPTSSGGSIDIGVGSTL